MAGLVSRNLFPLMTLAALGALGAALISQFAFDLEPCVLCIYQRVPYAAVLFLGAVGIWVTMINRAHLAVLTGLVFAAGAGVALYHVGVEQHWWPSAAGCGGVTDIPANFENFRAGLRDLKPVKPCDEIDWTLFGVSMATYNMAVSLGLAAVCLFAARRIGGGKSA